MNTILVQMSDETWTMQALHFACALARNHDARVILLRLMQVQHLGFLGTEFGSTPLSQQEYAAWLNYAETAEDYGIEIVRQSMQCWSPLEAIAEAADHVEAQVVFAHIPRSPIPYVDRLQRWQLQRRLEKAGRRLITLDQVAGDSRGPAIVINSAQVFAARK